MSDIYDQHTKAFANVSAYVILKDGQKVATIAFKFPKDGAGRLWAYVHWLGAEMVRGHANGYGYDKRSAACSSAVDKLPDDITGKDMIAGRSLFIDALRKDGGDYWDRKLSDAGFTVYQAV